MPLTLLLLLPRQQASAADLRHRLARRLARRLRAGSVYLNGCGQDYSSPFGGFKQSGNGREWGKYGLLDFLEFKAINGFYEA